MSTFLGRLYQGACNLVTSYTDTSPAATSIRDKAHNVAQLAGYVYNGGPIDALSHEASKPISDIINILNQLTEDNRTFLPGCEADPDVEDWENATLWDYIKLIKQLPKERARKLFNTGNLKTSEHYPAFEALILALEAEIEGHALIADLQEENKLKLTSKTKEAANKLIGTLDKLKTTQAGFLTTTRHNSKAHAELYTFIENLKTLQENLILKDEKAILEASDALTLTYSRIQKREAQVLQGKNFTRSEKSVITKLIISLQAFKELPSILKSDDRFSPNYNSLMNSIVNASKVLGDYVSSQEGALTKSIDLIATNAKKYAKEYIPFMNTSKSTSNVEDTTAMHILEAAINGYFFKMKGIQPLDDLLDELLEDCDRVQEGFKECFLDEIAKTKPGKTKKAALDHDYAKAHAFDSKEILNKAFEASLIETHESEEEDEVEAGDILDKLKAQSAEINKQKAERVAQENQNKEGNILVNYANDAINYISGFKSGIPTAALSMVGKTFIGLLENRVLENVIGSQEDATKTILKEIIAKTKEELSKAIASSKVEDYLKAFQTFKEYYSKQQVILDAFVLPTMFETDVEQIENPHEVLKTLRRDFERTSRKEAENTNWQLKLETKSKEFISNMRNYTVFSSVYTALFSKQGEDTKKIFADIVNKISNCTNETTRKRAFLREMRSAISSSDANWIKKFFFKRSLSWIYNIISFYVNQGSEEGFRYIDQLTENLAKKDAVNKIQLVKSVSHGISLYGKMLTDWSKEKGEKQVVIERMLREAKYNNGISQKQLYDLFASRSIDRFIKGSNVSSKALESFAYIKNWIVKPTFRTTNPISKGANVLATGVKVVIGGAAAAIASIGYGIGIVGEKIVNAIVRNSIKQFCYKNNSIDELVLTSRNSIYDSSPYVHTITKFIVGQLDILSKTLDGVIENDAQGNTMQVEMSVNTREHLTSAIKNYFNTLKLDGFSTAEEAEEYLSNKGITAQLHDKMDALLLPAIIDSMANIFVLGSDTLLKKNSLNENLYNLFDQLNHSLINQEAAKTEEEIEREKAEHFESETKLNRYMDKILKQLIHISVNECIDNYGNRQIREAEELRTWINKSLIGEDEDGPQSLIEQIRTDLDGYLTSSNVSYEKVNEDLVKITELKNKASEFLNELEGRILKFENNSNDKTIKEFHKQLNPLVKSLKNALDDKHLLGIFKAQRALEEVLHDLPIIEKLESRFEEISKLVQKTTDDPTQKEDLIKLDANYTLVNDVLIQLNINNPDNDEPVRLKKGIYKDLENKVFFNNEFYADWNESFKTYKNALEDSNTLELLSDENIFDKIRDIKIQMLATRQRRFPPRVVNKKDLLEEFANLKSNMNFKRMPSTQKKLSSLLLELTYEANTEEAINEKIEELQETIDGALERQQAEVEQLGKKILDNTNEIKTLLSEATEKLEEIHENAFAEREEAGDSTLENTDELKDSCLNLKKINFIRVNLGIIDRLKGTINQTVYHSLKPKVSLSLIRKGTFAQFLANHVIFQPFLK